MEREQYINRMAAVKHIECVQNININIQFNILQRYSNFSFRFYPFNAHKI